jgi:hypothetical protein
MSIVPAAKNHPVGADATVVGVPQLPCRMTRPEFMQALERSGYGERDAVYRTFFHRADDGSPLCNTCGLPIGHHSNSDPAVVVPVPEPPSSRRGESEIPFPPPDCTIQQYCNNPKLQHPYVGAVTPYPPHWVGAAWYASLIEFVGHSRNETTTVHYGGKNPHSITTAHALLKYRCTIDGCGKVFEVEGPVVDPKNSASAGPVFLRTMGNGESIEAHMSSTHGLLRRPHVRDQRLHPERRQCSLSTFRNERSGLRQLYDIRGDGDPARPLLRLLHPAERCAVRHAHVLLQFLDLAHMPMVCTRRHGVTYAVWRPHVVRYPLQ